MPQNQDQTPAFLMVKPLFTQHQRDGGDLTTAATPGAPWIQPFPMRLRGTANRLENKRCLIETSSQMRTFLLNFHIQCSKPWEWQLGLLMSIDMLKATINGGLYSILSPMDPYGENGWNLSAPGSVSGASLASLFSCRGDLWLSVDICGRLTYHVGYGGYGCQWLMYLSDLLTQPWFYVAMNKEFEVTRLTGAES